MVLSACLFVERYPLVVGCRPLFNQLILQVEIKCMSDFGTTAH